MERLRKLEVLLRPALPKIETPKAPLQSLSPKKEPSQAPRQEAESGQKDLPAAGRAHEERKHSPAASVRAPQVPAAASKPRGGSAGSIASILKKSSVMSSFVEDAQRAKEEEQRETERLAKIQAAEVAAAEALEQEREKKNEVLKAEGDVI